MTVLDAADKRSGGSFFDEPSFYNELVNSFEAELSDIESMDVIPDFMDDHTAFERLIFCAVPVLNIIRQRDPIFDAQRPSSFLWMLNKDNGGKAVAAASVSSYQELIEAIINILYNFYGFIDGRYFRKPLGDDGGMAFLCGTDSSKSCFITINTKFLMDKIWAGYTGNNGEPDIDKIVWYKSQSESQWNKTLLPDISSLNSKYMIDVWDDIKDTINRNLYITNDEKEELNSCFDKMSKAGFKLLADISMSGRNGFKRLRFLNEYESEYLVINKYLCVFPSEQVIVDYNNAFYELSGACVKNNSVFTQSDEARKIVNRIVNIGVPKSNVKGKHTEDIERFWLMSPFALNSLRNCYERLCKFVNDEWGHKHEGCFKHVLYNAIANSAIADFKRWIYVNGSSAIVTFEGEGSVLRAYDAHLISSLSLVRPIRLYEKIKDFLDKASENGLTNEPFEICIVGYARLLDNKAVEIDELARLVSKTFPDTRINYTAKINKRVNKNQNTRRNNKSDALTKTSLLQKYKDEVEKYCITISEVDYDWLFLKQNIENLIDDYDMVFFIDCPDLYYDEFNQKIDGSWYSMYNSMRYNSYGENYIRAHIGERFNVRGVLGEAEQQFSVLSNINAKGYGSYTPVIKDYILNHMEEYVKGQTSKTVYLYMSTLDSYMSDKYSDHTFTHTEKYHDKLFYIVKLCGRDVSRVEDAREKDADLIIKPMNFSLWNVIKNVGLSLKDSYFSVQKAGKSDTEYILNNVAIRFLWDERMESFRLEWGVNSDVLEPKKLLDGKLFERMNNKNAISNFLKDIFNLVLGAERSFVEDMIKESIGNILLARADNVYQILLYYRLMKDDIKSKIQCAYIDDKYEIQNILDNNKISGRRDKKLYLDMIDTMSTHTVSPIARSSLKRHIIENDGDFDFIFENILYACKQCRYTDSDLYRNMKGI